MKKHVVVRQFRGGAEEPQEQGVPSWVQFQVLRVRGLETSRRRIRKRKFVEYQYEKVQIWYVSKSLPMPDYEEACDLCTMKCPG